MLVGKMTPGIVLKLRADHEQCICVLSVTLKSLQQKHMHFITASLLAFGSHSVKPFA